MYRVFLKIFKVELHIKEPVVVEINIRKRQHSITIPAHFPLIDGKSHISTSYQFHISSQNPSFQLCILICLHNSKKLAGTAQIDLKHVPRHQTIHICDSLKNCPDKNSLIQFQFMYFQSQSNLKTLQIISQQDIQSMQQLKQLAKIQQTKQQLEIKNKSLQTQFNKLMQQNRTLNTELTKIQTQQQIIEQAYYKELKFQEKRQNQCLENLKSQKFKLAQILDIVFESGDPSLIQMVQRNMEADINYGMEQETE